MDAQPLFSKADMDAINRKPVVQPDSDQPDKPADAKPTVLHRLRLHLPW